MLIFSLVVLILAGLCGVLGFWVLPKRNRGFAKVMFYVLLMLGLIIGFFGLMQATVR